MRPSSNDDVAIARQIAAATREALTSLPDLSTLPRNVDRKTGAELVTRFFFPVTQRTMEDWPLAWRRVAGRAVVPTPDLFDYAASRLTDAPAIRGGRRAMQEAA
jgi:hypothetical protein